MFGWELALARYDRGARTWQPFSAPAGTRLLGGAGDGTVWFTTSASGFAVYRGGAFAELPDPGCVGASFLAFGPRGSAWFQCETPQRLARFEPDSMQWATFPAAVDVATTSLLTLADGRVLLAGRGRRAAVLEPTGAGPVERMLTVPCALGIDCLGCETPNVVGPLGTLYREGASETLLLEESGAVGRLSAGALEYEQLAQASLPSEMRVSNTGAAVDAEGRLWFGMRWGRNTASDTGRIFMLTPRTKQWALVLETEDLQAPGFLVAPGAPTRVIAWDQRALLELTP